MSDNIDLVPVQADVEQVESSTLEMMPLPVIEEVLSEGDLNFIREIDEATQDVHRGHSSFQIHHFILNDDDFPLYADKYWQAKLELSGRLDGVYTEMFSLRDVEIDIQLLLLKVDRIEEQLEKIEDPSSTKARELVLRREQYQNRIAQRKIQKRSLVQHIKNRFREMRHFKNAMDVTEPLLEASSYEEKDGLHWQAIKRWRESQRATGMAQLPTFGKMKEESLRQEYEKRGLQLDSSKVGPSLSDAGRLQLTSTQSEPEQPQVEQKKRTFKLKPSNQAEVIKEAPPEQEQLQEQPISQRRKFRLIKKEK